MKAVVYTTKRQTGAKSSETDAMIIELWIDELKVCINELNEIFRKPEPRMAYKHYGTINLTDVFCNAVESHLKSKENFDENNSKIFHALKQKYHS